MRATEPTEPALNWDFTPVFDLLRSPTTNGGTSSPARHFETTVPSGPKGQSKQDAGYGASGPVTDLKPRRSHHKLGDFGSLWDLLSQDSNRQGETARADTTIASSDHSQFPLQHASPVTFLKSTSRDGPAKRTSHSGSTQPTSRSAPVSRASKPRISTDTVPGRPARSPTQDHAYTILKRAADNKSSSKDTTTPLPQTPPKPITGSNSTETPKAKSKAKASGKGSKSKPDVMLSESSADADSDSSTIVFDRPITQKPKVLAFVPSQVGTPDAKTGHYETPPSSYDDLDSALNSDTVQNIITTSAGNRVLPAAYKTATERRIGLMTKLLKEFPEYAQLVSQVGRSPVSSNKRAEPGPIHVFVDMSNIMVGFHDSVKVSRNIPVATRIRRLHMSFSNFSLIMERGRPATKRVLVGSDRLPSIDEAETLGYEANILDRVNKAKHTTPRPSKFRKGPTQMASNGPETVGASGNRWVEQGVDEILHLKILESLLDTDVPATIVLATGDAAEAEYSGGFMRMVERALQRGWSVELVSFAQVTSNAYRRKEFRAKWGNRFRVVELDSYVEELFD